MLAVTYRPGRGITVEERPSPRPGEGEALVRVEASSICATDLRIVSGGHHRFGRDEVRVLGHEVVGTVEISRTIGLTEGSLVFVAPNFGCGRCRWCQRSDVNLCAVPRAVGITDDGGFADYLLLPGELIAQQNVMAVPPGTDPAAAALAEPLAAVLRGSRACRIAPGDVVLVLGAGPIGLLHVALARLAGARTVIVSEPNPARRQIAGEWGAAAVESGSLAAALEAAGAPRGADAVIVAVGVPAAQRQALELAAPGARVNFFAGVPRSQAAVELETNLIHYKELVVTGTSANTNADCRDALDLVARGTIDTAALISARLRLEQGAEAFDLAASGTSMKVVIQPWHQS